MLPNSYRNRLKAASLQYRGRSNYTTFLAFHYFEIYVSPMHQVRIFTGSTSASSGMVITKNMEIRPEHRISVATVVFIPYPYRNPPAIPYLERSMVQLGRLRAAVEKQRRGRGRRPVPTASALAVLT